MGIITEPFDLIVDDGSHRPSDQFMTAKFTLPIMRSGVYVIEDVDNGSVEQLMRLLKEHKPKEYHVGSRHDDRLIVCQK